MHWGNPAQVWHIDRSMAVRLNHETVSRIRVRSDGSAILQLSELGVDEVKRYLGRRVAAFALLGVGGDVVAGGSLLESDPFIVVGDFPSEVALGRLLRAIQAPIVDSLHR